MVEAATLEDRHLGNPLKKLQPASVVNVTWGPCINPPLGKYFSRGTDGEAIACPTSLGLMLLLFFLFAYRPCCCRAAVLLPLVLLLLLLLQLLLVWLLLLVFVGSPRSTE